jgi:catalase
VKLSPAEGAAAAHEVFGRHDGYRALHAKGTLLKGTFTASPEAAELTRAGHLQGEQVPVTARFSNGSGHPKAPDNAPDVRGLGVKFYLPDGSRTDIVAQTAPRFPNHTPEEFVGLVRATKPSAAAWRMPLFFARHPGALLRLPTNARALLPPESYATARYYAVHAYRFVAADGGSTHVRYTWIPEAGEKRIGLRAMAGRDREFLQQEIRARLQRGPVRFFLELQIAAPGDEVDDPAVYWPQDRRTVRAGTLELTDLETGREQDGDILIFDPTRVVDGIELTNDPVLRYRSQAYAESVKQRSGEGTARGGLASREGPYAGEATTS